jgi:tetratricopeptide (TPR) repeat protein
LRSFIGLSLALFVCTFNSLGQNVTTPRPVSPAAEIKQTIGLSEVTVNYSRPRLTLNGVDRTGKIWGQQVPYGLSNPGAGTATQAPWRAGANENTVISFSDDVKIEGKPLAAGKYGFHIIVHEDNRATLIFSKTYTSWGNFFYDAKDDALRVDISTKVIPNTEVLTYEFEDMGNDYAVLALSWEKKKFPLKIEFDVHKIVLARFRDELRSLPGFGWQGFQTAATYCLNNNINLEEALGWADIAATRNKTFPTLSTKAAVLYQMGRQAESEKILDEAVATATMAQINAVGYQLLAAKRFDKAIEILQVNVKNNPTDANSFDSLGEAYKMSGDKDNAIKNLRKSLSLNPPEAVKANSEKLLKELGAM